ncbi:thioredoxin-dependent thiol peroxidase [Propionispora vibrioides]|uniref:thioredoxin-dependent peroxiredoxin n=1 Tax=Propionispora vibrioides TaxID=112903 RepID=A0A1H8WZN4_9FIRM|nr:thioredoxin-dependent thiol peroxidase [Propionispora vibrioides]SEP33069.1 peroxiredoxin Q/BCP [Propionispora vibrioides]
MELLAPGSVAPDFSLLASNGQQVSLRQWLGKSVVLYFYPKDNTPGCTQEACEFRDAQSQLEAKQAIILGVSRDPITAHTKFIGKFNLPFLLLSDPDGVVAGQYGVWKEKNMYGKKVMGIERSTFIIDPQGVISHVFRKVKVAGHIEQVLKLL